MASPIAVSPGAGGLPVFTSLRGYRAEGLRSDQSPGLAIAAVALPIAHRLSGDRRPATPGVSADRVAVAALLAVAVGVLCLVARVLGLEVLANFLSRPILTGFFAGISLSIMVGLFLGPIVLAVFYELVVLGGTISYGLAEKVSPRVLRVIALPAPSDREKTQIYFQRCMAHLPAAGEVVIFDRSRYNRPGVERVMGFTPAAGLHRPQPRSGGLLTGINA